MMKERVRVGFPEACNFFVNGTRFTTKALCRCLSKRALVFFTVPFDLCNAV